MPRWHGPKGREIVKHTKMATITRVIDNTVRRPRGGGCVISPRNKNLALAIIVMMCAFFAKVWIRDARCLPGRVRFVLFRFALQVREYISLGRFGSLSLLIIHIPRRRARAIVARLSAPTHRLNSLGFPRVYNQNSKLVFLLKCQTMVYRTILPVYGTFDEISCWGHVEGTTKPSGGLPILLRYYNMPLFGKSTTSVFIFKMPKTVYPWFHSQITVHQPVYGTFNDKKTNRGIPMYRLLSRYTALWQNKSRGFSFVLVLDDLFSFY